MEKTYEQLTDSEKEQAKVFGEDYKKYTYYVINGTIVMCFGKED